MMPMSFVKSAILSAKTSIYGKSSNDVLARLPNALRTLRLRLFVVVLVVSDLIFDVLQNSQFDNFGLTGLDTAAPHPPVSPILRASCC